MEGIRNGALEALRQGRELLSTISSTQYTETCSSAFNATIGQHYRHCLDHFDTFLHQADGSSINYDLRLRKQLLETSIIEALRTTGNFEDRIMSLGDSDLIQRVTLNTGVGEDQLAMCETTLARELYYVTAHAIHHFALIAVIGSHFNLKMPKNFGVAPSTVAYLASQTKA